MKKAAIFLILFLIFASFVWGQQATFTWKGASGDNWDDPDSWECIGPTLYSYPGDLSRSDDIVIIENGAAVTLDVTVSLDSITIDNASLDLGVFLLTVNSLSFINGAELTGDLVADNITIDDSSVLNGTISFSGGGDLNITSNVVNITGADIVCGNLDLGSRDINVTQSGVGGVAQIPLTVIKTPGELSLSADGTIELTEANEVAKLEITKADGKVEFTNNAALEVVGVTANNDVTITIDAQNDSITISGNFSAKDLTIINTGSGDVQIGNVNINLNGNFDIKNTELTLYGSGTSRIKAAAIDAGSIDVTDDGTININAAAITTTGNQNYGNGPVTLNGAAILTGEGRITAGGKVTGTGVTFNALHGISLTNAANALSGNITLDNTQSGAVSGNITFTNTSTLTGLTAKNNTANGKITIDQAGNLPINLLQTTGASGSISIEADGAVTQTGAITTSDLTVKTGMGITLANSTNDVTASVDLTSADGNINFVNAHGSAGDLYVAAAVNNGNVTIKETNGGLVVGKIDAVGKTVSLDAAGNITQMPAKKIEAGALTVGTSANITLDSTNLVTTSVDFTSSGNIEFVNDIGSEDNLAVTVNTTGNVTITEESGGLEVDQIISGANIDLKAGVDIGTKGITVSGVVKLKAGGDITVTDVAAYQLIAITVGVVKVKTVNINSANTEREKENAAIYIEAENFVVEPELFGSIVPGGQPPGLQWGQLCLNLNQKWTNPNKVVDGEEDDPDNLGSKSGARWHQYFIDLSGKNLVYGNGSIPPSYTISNYIIVNYHNKKTEFDLEDGYDVYIYNVDITQENINGLRFKTGGSGTIRFFGSNKFTNLELETESDITLEYIDTLGDITVKTSIDKIININQSITATAGTTTINGNSKTTTGTQEYKGTVALGGSDPLITLKGTDVTLEGVITGNGKSLTIDGKGVLNGGSGIEDLSVTEDFSLASGTLSAATVDVTGTSDISGNITTAGDQTYTKKVTLGGDVTLTSTAGSVTLGAITGNSKSLTITGIGVLNGGSGINELTVSGTTVINKDIAATGAQTYTKEVTLGGDVTLTSTAGSVTLGAITGNGNPLAIDGNGVLNGGSGINELTVSGTTVINKDIAAAGAQTYTKEVTLGGDVTLTSTAGSVTLGAITGNSKSLTITGIGVLNGGSGINELTVSGDFSLTSGTLNAAAVDITGKSNIAGNITTTGSQIYKDEATLGGSGERVITSDNGSIEFSGILNSLNVIKLLAAKGNITIAAKTTAYQLIAKASTSTGIVKVSAITINSSNTGNEGDNAAIYIVADNFTVTPTTTPKSIVPGGTGGQLCLHLNKKWLDTNGVVDGQEDDPVGTPGARWHQHFMIVGKILYSFTEDSNGNGRLDRIRVQTNKELSGNFNEFEVSVDGGYKVIKFELVNNNDDSFYIYLEEKTEFDGDKTPKWSITKNTSLIDATHNPMVDQTEMKYIDTIPPRIVYTLTLPGHPQTYVQISEPVQTLSGVNISAGDISFDGRTVTAVKEIDLGYGYLFDYSTPYRTEDLANLTIDSETIGVGYFQMNNIVDKGKKPEPSEIDPNYPPKYPTDWNYTAYTDNNGLVPPNELISVMFNPDSNPARRVTDVLVSLSPNNYFVLPVWAKPSKDNISIMEFDGSKYLEKDPIEKSGIELQARISNNLAITPQLFWTMADIPANMRNPKEASEGKKIGGLWLPSALINPLYYYVPLSSVIKTALVSNISPLFNYDIPANDLANSGAKFEFIFRSSSVSDMFIARLDAPPDVIPNNWYTLIRPFSFNIQSIRYQRGGVTILNNVINSDNKETAYIRYDLPRAGRVTVQIYTLDGTVVKSIRRNESREPGAYIDTWDGSNNGGRAVARGMYFVRVVGPDIDEIRKIMVVK